MSGALELRQSELDLFTEPSVLFEHNSFIEEALAHENPSDFVDACYESGVDPYEIDPVLAEIAFGGPEEEDSSHSVFHIARRTETPEPQEFQLTNSKQVRERVSVEQDRVGEFLQDYLSRARHALKFASVSNSRKYPTKNAEYRSLIIEYRDTMDSFGCGTSISSYCSPEEAVRRSTYSAKMKLKHFGRRVTHQ